MNDQLDLDFDTITISGSDSMYSSSVSGTAGAYTWNTTNSGTYNIDWGTSITLDPNLKVEGDAEIKGDLKVAGKSIVESLEKIEERLAILRPNTELEERWEELRSLRNKYMKLEKEIKEKEMIWSVLKI